jgi:hypothetical protein
MPIDVEHIEDRKLRLRPIHHKQQRRFQQRHNQQSLLLVAKITFLGIGVKTDVASSLACAKVLRLIPAFARKANK